MKKMIVIAAVAAAVVSAKAASVDWAVSATSAEVGYTVYLLTSVGDYADVSALAAAAVGSAQVKSLGRGKYGTGDQTSKGSGITTDSMKDAYYAIVTGTDATSFKYVSIGNLSGNVYDADAQETSPGAFDTVSAANILAGTSKDFGGGSGGGGGDVPEPTSGLLLLVGGAMLALRRRRA